MIKCAKFPAWCLPLGRALIMITDIIYCPNFDLKGTTPVLSEVILERVSHEWSVRNKSEKTRNLKFLMKGYKCNF